MPTRVIDGSGGRSWIYENGSGDPALLISGTDKEVILIGDLSGTGTGPTVAITGANAYLRLDSGGSVTAGGTTAILGSGFGDEIVNNGGAIIGDVLLGGGNDLFQNNRASAVGRVFGGDGDDYLSTFEGSVAVSYHGDAGNDFLRGGSAGDRLNGDAGSDALHGEDGDDQLAGGSGDDRLTGGLGNDELAGGGEAGDIALFQGFMSKFDIDMAGGAGVVTDTDSSDGDEGRDTLSGISVLRFTDQQVDLRITRDSLILAEPGQTYANTTDRYDYFAVELRGDGVKLINHAKIVGTAVPHSVLGAYGYQSVDTGAIALFVYNATVENRAGASIIGFDEAIGVVEQPATRAGDGLRVLNDGLIQSLESIAIRFDGRLTVTNGATGTIIGGGGLGYGVFAPNGHAFVVNSGRIEGSYRSIAAGLVDLDNTGIIVGTIESGYYGSRIDNSGSISGGYDAWGGLTLLNTGQSSGNLEINVYPVSHYAIEGYTYTTIDNRGAFTGDILITGSANFLAVPPAHADYRATIANSGTITGSIVSDPTLQEVPGGGTADASFVEDVVNSGTITGDVRLGDGNDTLVNTGTIGGLVDGGAGDDTLEGGVNADRLQGGAGDDVVRGGGGDDVLAGGAGSDMLVGGPGDDLYLLWASDGAATGDAIVEQPGEGADEIRSDLAVLDLALHPDIEKLTGTSSTGQTLSGNGLANIILAGTGADTLAGGQGDDRLDGGAGGDTMRGGAGDDTYVVDSTGDAVIEASGEGIDEVRTALGSRNDPAQIYVLPADVENLTGTSASAQGVRGNSLDNVIKMGAAGDLVVLDAGGNDSVDGGGGNDFLYFGGAFTAQDKAAGGAGNDTVALLGSYDLALGATSLAGVERLALYSSGNAAAPNGYSLVMHDGNVAAGQTLTVVAQSLLAGETLVFNASAETNGSFNVRAGRGGDTITGGAGADTIWGNLGADVLKGGAGADSFEYRSVAESTAASRDTILDFTRGDKVNLGGIDADGNAANGDSRFAFIGGAAFSGTAGELRVSQDPNFARAWLVEGDTDGDRVADFSLIVVAPNAYPLGRDDFFL